MTEFKYDDVFVGRTDSGDRIYITAQTRHHADPAQTVHHETVTEYSELSIMGLAVAPRRRMENGHAAGQIVSELERVTRPAPHLTEADIAELVRLWKRWHLNGMKALCAHQTPVYSSPRGYRQLDLDAIGTCPVSGYRPGSAWLVEPVPGEVLETVHDIMRRATGE